MKAERRHELRESELAKELGKAGEFIKANLRALVTALIVLVAVILLVVTVITRRAQARSAEWRDYYALAVQPVAPAHARAELRRLAESTNQEPLAAWAWLRVGELAMEEMVAGHYALEPDALKVLGRDASEAFGIVLARHGRHVHPLAKAHLNMGQLAEITGDFEEARRSYRGVAELEPHGARPIVAEALRRLAQLDTMPADTAMAHRPPEPPPGEAPPAIQPDLPLPDDDFDPTEPPAVDPGFEPAAPGLEPVEPGFEPVLPGLEPVDPGFEPSTVPDDEDSPAVG